MSMMGYLTCLDVCIRTVLDTPTTSGGVKVSKLKMKVQQSWAKYTNEAIALSLKLKLSIGVISPQLIHCYQTASEMYLAILLLKYLYGIL